VVVGGTRLVEWVAETIQFEGLANSPNGILDSACLNLVASAKVTLLDPFSECLNDGDLLFVMEAL